MVIQKQPPRGIVIKRCSENTQQIYRRTPIRSVISVKLPKCDFNPEHLWMAASDNISFECIFFEKKNSLIPIFSNNTNM